MIPLLRRLRPALPLLAALALAACKPATGGSNTSPATETPPGETALSEIPLGAPPGQPLPQLAQVPNPYEGDADAVGQGKALFSAMNCVYCHGPQGAGLMGPSLNGSAWRYGGAPAQIYNSIHDGRPRGMPAWGSRLPPDQIWKLVAYIESLGGAQPPATRRMVQIGGPQPSTTGPQAADQVQADTAEAARVAANQSQGGR